MPARQTDAPDNSLLLLGEMRGQLRELIHKMNNREQKDEAVARTLAKLEDVPDRLERIETRITTLESDKSRRDGERGAMTWFVRSPLFAWLIGGAVTVWALLKGYGQ